jgi:hypothetical protein
MIKKLVLHFPDGSVRTLDAATHQITITDRKVVVKNEQGEAEEFFGMPIEVPHRQALKHAQRVVADGLARRRSILFG